MQLFVQLFLSSLWIGWTNAGAITATAIVYGCGWRRLHRLHPERYSRWELAAFAGGLASVWLALAPALESASALLLSAHMVQHLLLLVVAPPMLILGRPSLPLLRGLPRSLAHDGIAPFLHLAAAKKLRALFSRLLPCWLAFVVTLVLWHVPLAFDTAMVSAGWHHFEHVCFLGSSLLFWGRVIQPAAGGNNELGWLLPAYLLAADLANTALSAILTFSDRVLYAPYASVPRLFGSTPLTDQVAAGLIMWVPGSLFFVGPAFIIAWRQASSRALLERPPAGESTVTRHRIPMPNLRITAPRAIDLLEWPYVGRLLRGRSLRRTLQAVLFVLAVGIIACGFFGPSEAGANIACVLPWTYWRFFAVVSLLIAGNLSCMVCPFTLPRELGRRSAGRRRPWPKALRSKWVAVGLLLVLLWAYEAFSPWELPAVTAALVLAYFTGSYFVGRLFEGASFCRYICPIGQFQFVGSLASPLEVKIRRTDACVSCVTHDCIRGNADAAGCEMGLRLPVKNGNMDCTFCLDCVRACPHQNIGLFVVAPGKGLIGELPRSSLTRLGARSDVVALAIFFVFAAFANAAAMTGQVQAWDAFITHRFGISSTPTATIGFLLITIIVMPVLLVSCSTLAGLALARSNRNFGEIARKFALALVPLGLAMWLAHLSFHFISGWDSVRGPLRNLAVCLGMRADTMAEVYSPLMSADGLLKLQASMLGIGLLATLYSGWRIARRPETPFGRVLLLVGPWSVTSVGLYLAGIWIFTQPMIMGSAFSHNIAAR